MNRREWLTAMAGGFVIAGELWVPGKRTFFLPKTPTLYANRPLPNFDVRHLENWKIVDFHTPVSKEDAERTVRCLLANGASLLGSDDSGGLQPSYWYDAIPSLLKHSSKVYVHAAVVARQPMIATVVLAQTAITRLSLAG